MKQIICSECRGHGIVKMVAIPCESCGGRGKFCMHCENTSGYTIRPFEECEKCLGRGYDNKKKPEKINESVKSNEDTVDKLKNNTCELI